MTTDRDALLAAILAHPDDDTPRLVFADWLEEHGEATDRDRAAYIRTEIELAKIRPRRCEREAVEFENYAYTPRCRCRVCTLCRRSWEWIRRYRFECVCEALKPVRDGHLQAFREGRAVSFASGWAEAKLTRGFVSHIRLNNEGAIPFLAALFEANPIEEVVLPDGWRLSASPPDGQGGGWQVYVYGPGDEDYLTFNSWETRGAMVEFAFHSSSSLGSGNGMVIVWLIFG